MCDFGISEGAMAAIIISEVVAIAAETAVSITAAQKQAEAQQVQYDYQAKVAQKNAKIAQNNADQKRQEGIEEARQQRIKTLQKVGAQQAAMAANGIDVSSGTALDVIEDTAAIGELDALTTRYNYETKALAYEQQADNFNNQANLDTFAGQNAYQTGKLNATAAGIKGLGDSVSVASKWYRGNSNKIGGKPTGWEPSL